MSDFHAEAYLHRIDGEAWVELTQALDGNDPDEVLKWAGRDCMVHFATQESVCLLTEACSRPQHCTVALVSALLDRGAAVEGAGDGYPTPLGHTIRLYRHNPNPETEAVLHLLLDRGASLWGVGTYCDDENDDRRSPSRVTEFRESVWRMAVSQAPVFVLELFCKHGWEPASWRQWPSPSWEAPENPLWAACLAFQTKKDGTATVDWLLRQGLSFGDSVDLQGTETVGQKWIRLYPGMAPALAWLCQEGLSTALPEKTDSPRARPRM